MKSGPGQLERRNVLCTTKDHRDYVCHAGRQLQLNILEAAWSRIARTTTIQLIPFQLFLQHVGHLGGILAHPGGYLGPSWGHLGRILGILSHLKAILGPSCGRRLPEVAWVNRCRNFRAHFGVHFGAQNWFIFGDFLGPFFGPIFEHFLDHFWGHFGGHFGTRSAQEGAKISPRGPPRASSTQKPAIANTLKLLVF